MTAYTDFLADADAVMRHGNWTVDLEVLDADGVAVAVPGEVAGALRVASRIEGFRTRASDTPANARWRPDLAPENGGGGGLRLESSLWSGSGDVTIGGASLPSEAELVIGNRDGYYDAYLPAAGYRWEGRPATARFGSGVGIPGRAGFMALADFRAFRFELGGPRSGIGEIRVPLYGLDRRFDQSVHNLVYRGTNYCLDFAAAAYASIGTPAKMNLTGSMTYEAWLYADNLSATRRAMGWQAGTRTPWRVNVSTSGQVSFAYTHSAGTSAFNNSATGLFTAGRWVHVAVIIDGTAGTFLVYDGLTGLETVEAFTTAAATRDANTGGNLEISFNNATSSWVGPHDEERVWNIARTLDDVRRDRHGELTIVPATCVGYYKHNDATGLTTTDSSASPANGTLNGTCTWYHALEGDESLAGVSKGDSFGRTEFQTPTLVAPGLLIYHVGKGTDIDAIQPYDGLAAYSSGGADIASWKTLQTTAVSSGTFRTCLANGFVKLGSPAPTLKLTVSVEGGKGNETKGELIRELITERGEDPLADPADLDTAAFTAIDTADDSRHGLYIPAGRMITIRQGLDRLIGPGSWWGYPFDSQLFTLAQWTGPAVTADLEIGPQHILAVEPLGPAFRAWAIELLFGRIEPHSEAEINATVKTTPGSFITYQRGLDREGWSHAQTFDAQVLADHPRAIRHTYETLIQYPEPGVSITKPEGRAAALAEARRILTMLSQGWEPYRFRVDPIGLQLSLGATIAPVVEIGGDPRISFDGTRNLAVLGISVDPATWTVDITGVG